MSRRALPLLFILMLALTSNHARAESAAAVAANAQRSIDQGDVPEWWTPKLPADVQRDVDRKGRGLAEGLKLEDDAQTDRVAALVSQHFARVWAWHQQVDDRLDAAWADWDAARSNADGKEKDELRALAIATEQIDPIYAEFTPQIQGLLRDLRAEVGEEKATELMDRYTRSPGAERTYNAYLGMVPEMTADERAILWDRMAQAREESMAAWTGGRIIKIFKKQKVRNEFSIDYFGYGYRERYKAWASGGR
ncbi:hypothetical protein KOR34_12470 [Posidoniimonas corsicana]|uniref:DUF3826 domain-containing protein n=1 Tax=Posidoniimonas corsicana TaxID=1938618 RepID=A0A5C5VF67_9BACT|nr:DUF3826 domain-containing protein [Posidoniimonas corsicana]TWT36342.1 hypothetical protein KOR34_12470 [Posidoniimonas corsicana]